MEEALIDIRRARFFLEMQSNVIIPYLICLLKSMASSNVGKLYNLSQTIAGLVTETWSGACVRDIDK